MTKTMNHMLGPENQPWQDEFLLGDIQKLSFCK